VKRETELTCIYINILFIIREIKKWNAARVLSACKWKQYCYRPCRRIKRASLPEAFQWQRKQISQMLTGYENASVISSPSGSECSSRLRKFALLVTQLVHRGRSWFRALLGHTAIFLFLPDLYVSSSTRQRTWLQVMSLSALWSGWRLWQSSSINPPPFMEHQRSFRSQKLWINA
jgi:hypothetical protein